MQCVEIQTLQHKALFAIADSLWNAKYIRDLIAEVDYEFPVRKWLIQWQEIEDRIKQTVKSLPLPESMKAKVWGFAKLMGFQILLWLKYNCINEIIVPLPSDLSWTSERLIDRKKTAQTLCKDRRLDIYLRFKIACAYCLEEDILALWNETYKHKRRTYHIAGAKMHVKVHDLVNMWIYYIQGKTAKMVEFVESRFLRRYNTYSVAQYQFECAAVGGNKVATEHFLQQLTSEERELTILRTVEYILDDYDEDIRRNEVCSSPKYFADVLYYLLSLMNKEQQMKAFKYNPHKVLNCFLCWPYQHAVVETAKLVEDSLHCSLFYRFLKKVSKRVVQGYTEWDYQTLFRELWCQISAVKKEEIGEVCLSNEGLLTNLFKCEDKENIELFLKGLSAELKEKIIFTEEANSICEDLIQGDNWDLLMFFLRECISSVDTVKAFKQEFKCNAKDKTRKNKLKKFFQLLDDLFDKDNKKRSMDDSDGGPVKKPRLQAQ